MSRLWLGNFDFEHQLADPGYNRSAKMRALNAELSAHLLPLAATGDSVHLEKPLPDGFQQHAVDAGLLAPGVCTDFPPNESGRPWVVEPWGWSDAVVRDAQQIGIQTTVPRAGPQTERPARFEADPAKPTTRRLLAAAVERFHDWWYGTLAGKAAIANSRLYSCVMEGEYDAEVPGACGIFEFRDVEAAVRLAAKLWECRPSELRWIVKANYGMSGRERISGCGTQLNEASANWLRRRLKEDCLQFEPFVECIEEVSSQWHLPQDFRQPPELLGMTRVLCGHLGNFVPTAAIQDQLGGEYRESIIETARLVATEIHNWRYFGPLGIDAMVYDFPDGPQVRPIQDVNARWTMGRVLLEIGSRIGRDADLHWLHVPTDQLCRRLGLRREELSEFHARSSLDITDRWSLQSQPDDDGLARINALMDGSGQTRLFLTTPLWIGDQPANRTSVLCESK